MDELEYRMKPESRDALVVDLIELILEMLVSERVIAEDQVEETRERLTAQFQPDAALSELGWDSMQFASMLVHAEDRYGIVLGGLSTFDLFTVGDVVNEIWARIDEVK
jgi:acyl carrier protein